MLFYIHRVIEDRVIFGEEEDGKERAPKSEIEVPDEICEDKRDASSIFPFLLDGGFGYKVETKRMSC